MKIFKVAVTIALLLFFVVHTAYTLLFTLPENLVPARSKEHSKKYMFPVFDQGWALFAPAPELTKKVYVKYQRQNGEWSGWETPFDNYLNDARSNRFNAKEKLVLSINSALHYLYTEHEQKLQQKKNVPGNLLSGFYRVLKYACVRQLANDGNLAQQIKLLVVYTKTDCKEKEYYSLYFNETTE